MKVMNFSELKTLVENHECLLSGDHVLEIGTIVPGEMSQLKKFLDRAEVKVLADQMKTDEDKYRCLGFLYYNWALLDRKAGDLHAALRNYRKAARYRLQCIKLIFDRCFEDMKAFDAEESNERKMLDALAAVVAIRDNWLLLFPDEDLEDCPVNEEQYAFASKCIG